MPAGTVIIVNYCSRESAENCLNSLQSCITSGWIKVVVVDNDSGDAEAESLAKAFPAVEVISAGANLGFGGGSNLGLNSAVGNWACFLNPDSVVENGSLEALANYLSLNPRVGCIAPAVFNEQGVRMQSFYPFTTLGMSALAACGLHRLIPLNRVNGRWRLYCRPKNEPLAVDRILGAAMMMPKSVLDVLGGFDERFFLYSEEEDLCRRVHQAGWEVMYYPQAKITHRGGVSARRQKSLTIAAANWSRHLILEKYDGRFAAGLSRWVWMVALTLRLSATLLLPLRSRRDIIRGYIWSIRSLLAPGWFERALRPARPRADG